MKKIVIEIRNGKYKIEVEKNTKSWNHSFSSKSKAKSVVDEYRKQGFEVFSVDEDVNEDFDSIDADGNTIG